MGGVEIPVELEEADDRTGREPVEEERGCAGLDGQVGVEDAQEAPEGIQIVEDGPPLFPPAGEHRVGEHRVLPDQILDGQRRGLDRLRLRYLQLGHLGEQAGQRDVDVPESPGAGPGIGQPGVTAHRRPQLPQCLMPTTRYRGIRARGNPVRQLTQRVEALIRERPAQLQQP